MRENGIKHVAVKIVGISPLLMHNGILVDPENPWAIKMAEITAKKNKKTKEDLATLKYLEFQGSLYHSEKVGPYIPPDVIEGCIREGGKVRRKGTVVVSGVNCTTDNAKLIYDGPRDREELFKDKRFVDSRKVRLKRDVSVIRTRPRFDKWELSFELMVFTDVLNVADVQKALADGGRLKAIGDYRPKFGRFVVDKFNVEGGK